MFRPQTAAYDSNLSRFYLSPQFLTLVGIICWVHACSKSFNIDEHVTKSNIPFEPSLRLLALGMPEGQPLSEFLVYVVQSLSAMFKFVKHFGIRIILTKQDKPITEARTLSRTANNGYRQNHSQLSTS